VCYGHTHVAAIDRHGETIVLNPGAIYRASPHSIAVVDLPAVEASIIEL
jgi:predicted phosphodiesterase